MVVLVVVRLNMSGMRNIRELRMGLRGKMVFGKRVRAVEESDLVPDETSFMGQV